MLYPQMVHQLLDVKLVSEFTVYADGFLEPFTASEVGGREPHNIRFYQNHLGVDVPPRKEVDCRKLSLQTFGVRHKLGIADEGDIFTLLLQNSVNMP